MNNFQYQAEQFADLRILRYTIPGFEKLSLNKKLYIYYLSEAALYGRDILWDQNNADNLWLRRNLEALYQTIEKEDASYPDFEIYFKRVLFSNGMHHHYSTEKLAPAFAEEDLDRWLQHPAMKESGLAGSIKKETNKLKRLLFDKEYASKRVCQDEGVDLVTSSANNFYEDVSQEEVEAFYGFRKKAAGPNCESFGLNSTLVKKEGELTEEIWKADGKYGSSIEKIVYWLEKACEVAENEQQQAVIQLLIQFYQTGDLKVFDQYSIEWIKEQQGSIDFINGFIEVYGDPLGYKATWESLVNIVDEEETKKAALISDYAQWFEDQSPVDEKHRKEEVKGVSMKVINAIMLGGDCYPASPLGINLPNAEWIRETHGSKSVSLENISHSYQMASLSSGVIEEFAWSEEEVALHKKYGAQADNLHTHLHECLGHGSGRMEEGVSTDALKAYGSVIEEARADLYGLYFMADEKMLELGLVDHMDVAKAQYNSYIRNGLMVQLARIGAGANIEQTHMRNRQLISAWVLRQSKESRAVELKEKDGKVYSVVNDYQELKRLFGVLLKEIQRIKSQGDYQAAKQLVENFGVRVDQRIHQQVLERYAKLNLAPYSGFINPVLHPVKDDQDNMTDVTISYEERFIEQMLRYNKDYSFE
ncbi:MAG: dipeptidyl peptidase 3 [Carboxylicivirga sp.]|jgi:dipeptidyl-peptidase-3|nr:dipeptidyl peptidase 3 [Carboxylicivirga sp.]